MTLPRPATAEERSYLLRFSHPERWPMLARFPVSAQLVEQLTSEMLGCSAEEVRLIDAALLAELTGTLGELLADARFRSDVAGLPLVASDVVAAVGDSLTADRLGWAELLGAALRSTATPASFVNLGLSGNTTADVLERWDLIAAEQPDWVIIMLGTNDARLHGKLRRRMVSPAETVRNLTSLRRLVEDELGSRCLVVTPPPAHAELSARFFAGQPLGWQAHDVSTLVDVIRASQPDCLDLYGALAGADTSAWEDDGIHLSPRGHRDAARAIAALWSVRPRGPQPVDAAPS